MLPIVLPPAELEDLHADALAGQELTVDLERKVIVRPEGKGEISFQVDDFRRHCLINGLDDIGRESRVLLFCRVCLEFELISILTPCDSYSATPGRDRRVRDPTDGDLALVGRPRLRQEGWQGTRQAGQPDQEEDGLVVPFVFLHNKRTGIPSGRKSDCFCRVFTIVSVLLYHILYSISCAKSKAKNKGNVFRTM